MYDRPVSSVMVTEKLVIAAPATTVREAAGMMASHNVGAVLVVEDEKLVGIFTERDAVFRVVAPGRDVKTTPIAEVNRALADPKMRERLAELGGKSIGGTPEDFGKVIAAETAKWASVVISSGAKVE